MSLREDYNTDGLAGEIIGLHLESPKGAWQIGDEKIAIGPDGFKFTFFAPTARWGRILWVDERPADKVLHKYSDGFPVYEELPEGWSHHTMVYGAAADGQLLTFTSAYGARKTFKNVIQQYLARGRRLFPTCNLATKPRGDQYGNIDPVLNISGWVSVNSFADIFPGLVEAIQLVPATAPVEAPEKLRAPDTEAQAARRPLLVVTSGREAPPIAEDDGRRGPDPDDVCPF
jgi:hypothetical protein